MTPHTPSGQQAVEHLAELFRDWFKSSGVDFWGEANAPEELAEIAIRTAASTAPSTVYPPPHPSDAHGGWTICPAFLGRVMKGAGDWSPDYLENVEAVLLSYAKLITPSTAAGERERLEEERNRLSNHFGYGARLDGSTRERIAAIDARLAALATPPAQMKYGEKTYGEGRDEAANFIFTGLSEALGLDGFTIQDGSETWEGDVRATLMGILRDANVIDEETNERITPPAPSVPWEEQAARQCEEWAIVLTAKGSNAAKVFDRIQFNADAVKLRDHARAFRALLSKPAKGE